MDLNNQKITNHPSPPDKCWKVKSTSRLEVKSTFKFPSISPRLSGIHWQKTLQVLHVSKQSIPIPTLPDIILNIIIAKYIITDRKLGK